MLAKEQYIGAFSLLAIALGAWVYVALHPPKPLPNLPADDKALRDSLRRDSIRMAKARRDSLRTARWEQKKDSFRQADELRFKQWTAERQQRYDSFKRADSLWRDSVGMRFSKRLKKDTLLDLNQTDTSELQLIRGIGRYTALQIIRYREQLGGYYSPEQLKDEPFAKLRLDTLLQHFTADAKEVKRISVNHCNTEELSRHPYLRYKQAKAIYELRRKKVKLESPEDLRGIDGISPEELERISPYLLFE